MLNIITVSHLLYFDIRRWVGLLSLKYRNTPFKAGSDMRVHLRLVDSEILTCIFKCCIRGTL